MKKHIRTAVIRCLTVAVLAALLLSGCGPSGDVQSPPPEEDIHSSSPAPSQDAPAPSESVPLDTPDPADTDGPGSSDPTDVPAPSDPADPADPTDPPDLPAPTEPPASPTAERYTVCGLDIPIPEDIRDQILVFTGEDLDSRTVLLSVYERRSYEDSMRDYDFAQGFLFALLRYDQSEYENYFLASDIPGESFFARDGYYYYGWAEPTDVQFYRSDTEDIFQSEDLGDWAALTQRVPDIKDDFIACNGLTPYSDDEFFRRDFTWDSAHCYAQFFGEDPSVLLVLSQPVKQGPEGIWCVERRIDPYGNAMLVFPGEEGLAAADYYLRLQTQVDYGERTELLDPAQVAAEWLNGLYYYDPSIVITADDVIITQVRPR